MTLGSLPDQAQTLNRKQFIHDAIPAIGVVCHSVECVAKKCSNSGCSDWFTQLRLSPFIQNGLTKCYVYYGISLI